MNVTSVSAARCYRANRDSWRHMAMRRSATALIEAASLTLCRADRTAFAKRRRRSPFRLVSHRKREIVRATKIVHRKAADALTG